MKQQWNTHTLVPNHAGELLFDIRNNNDIRVFQNLKEEVKSVYFYKTASLDEALQVTLPSYIEDGKITAFKDS